MSLTFSVAKEPWITCVNLEGEVVHEGLHDVLEDAHQLKEVSEASPLVTASVYRLLIALVHRIYQPQNLEDWENLWKGERFAGEPLDEYFERHKDRFNLFDQEHPFLQVGRFEVNKTSTVSKLSIEETSKNNAVLFDHHIDSSPDSITPAEATRRLVAFQQFDLAGGNASIPTINGNRVPYKKKSMFRDGPLARDTILVLRGNTLFETLMLNTIVPEFRDEILVDSGTTSWESRSMPVPFKERTLNEYLPLLTGQSRWVRLIADDSSGSTVVKGLFVTQGDWFSNDYFDPMKKYVRGKKEWFAKKLIPEKALWRESAAWLELNKETKGREPSIIAPACIRQTNELVARGKVGFDKLLLLTALGQSVEGTKATVLAWREEALSVPLKYFERQEYVEYLSQSLGWAEKGARDLESAISVLTQELIKERLANVKSQKKKEEMKKKIAEELLEQLDVLRRYWPHLELPFFRLLEALPHDPDTAQSCWMEEITSTIRHALNEGLAGLPHRARDLSAAMAAKGILAGRIKAMKELAPMIEEDSHDES